MASPRTRRLRNYLLAFCLLGSGLWLSGTALCQLVRRAVFVHEAVVVTGTVIDVRQKPFEGWAETLGVGNLSWPGDVSYQPIVRFTLPGGIDAIRLDLEPDNVDYRTGQEVSIISPPSQPGKAHINRWKFLWGAACLRFGVGALLALIGYALLRRLRGHGKGRAGTTKAPPAPARHEATSAPAKPRTPRKRKSSAAADNTSTPRRSKKAEGAATESAPAKPRRSRKKKAQEQSPKLPF